MRSSITRKSVTDQLLVPKFRIAAAMTYIIFGKRAIIVYVNVLMKLVAFYIRENPAFMRMLVSHSVS